MGSGTMDEAQAWVEYCNGTGNTSWANLRRQHGHPEPYSVRYWGLGNEMYGSWQIGNMNAHDYVKKARAFAMVMKRTDPSIELIGCGQNGWSEWDEIVLGGLAEFVDYHSIHLYTGSPDHYATVFQSHQAERAVRICAALIERVRYAQRIAHPIHIAFDEWNVWYRTRSHEDRVGGVEERYNLTDALAVATYLNGFIRQCRVVRMANFAQLVNAIAPIFTNPHGLFLQTIYHPLRLYAEHTLADGLDVHVDGETYDLPPAQEARARRPRPPRERPRSLPAARRRRHLRRGRARGRGDRRQPRPRPRLAGHARPRRRDARRPRPGLGGERPRRHATNSFEAPRQRRRPGASAHRAVVVPLHLRLPRPLDHRLPPGPALAASP